MDSIKTIIFQIKEKPALYLPYNSIRCLKAFIIGWYTRSPELIEDYNLLENDFMKWIHLRYDVSIHSWDRTIEFFSHNEYEALNSFFELFDEFLDTTTEGDKDS